MNDRMNAEFPMSNVMSHVTLNVRITGQRTYAVRLRMGVWLIKLAAWILGCHVNIETDVRA